MKANRKNKAVSEIVGTVMLLGIAIAMFAIVQLFAFSLLTENQNTPSVRLLASIDDRYVTIFHNGGESLPLDTKILFTINDVFANTISINASDNLTQGDSGSINLWDIGEKVVYNLKTSTSYSIGDSVSVMVVDVPSNSVIMSATIKE